MRITTRDILHPKSRIKNKSFLETKNCRLSEKERSFKNGPSLLIKQRRFLKYMSKIKDYFFEN